MRRKLLIVWLLLSLLPFPAQAGFSDTWDALKQNPSGVKVTFSSPEVTKLNAKEEALSLLNAYLSPFTLEVSDIAGNGTIRLSDRESGEAAAFRLRETPEALPYLSAEQALRGLWDTGFPALFTALCGEEPPEIEEKGTSFRVLGYSASRQSLTVSKALFSVLPKEALTPVLDGLKAVFRDYEVSPAVSAYLDQLTLEGEMTVRRNLNGEGQDLAYQFAGRIGTGGEDVRKLTFIIGKNGDIYYFSVKAPAVRGGNNFQAALTVPKRSETKTKSSRKITLSIRRTVDKETWKLDDSLQLSSQKGKEEAITAVLERETSDGSVKQTWSGTLRLSATEDGHLDGTLSFRQLHASSDVIRWQANVSVSPAEAETAADTVTETQAVMMLAGLLTKKKNQLPEKERRQLEHLLRTDAWMNGASVPPLPETEETEE